MTEMTTDCSKSSILLRSPGFLHSSCPPAMHKSCFCIRFIAEHTKITDDATKVSGGRIRPAQVRKGLVGLNQVKLCEDRPDQFDRIGARAKDLTVRQNAHESSTHKCNQCLVHGVVNHVNFSQRTGSVFCTSPLLLHRPCMNSKALI